MTVGTSFRSTPELRMAPRLRWPARSIKTRGLSIREGLAGMVSASLPHTEREIPSTILRTPALWSQITTQHFPEGRGTKRLPGSQRDTVGDEANTAVAHADLDAAGVHAPWRHDHVAVAPGGERADARCNRRGGAIRSPHPIRVGRVRRVIP